MGKRALFILTLMLLMGAVGARAAEAYAYFDSSDGRLIFCYDNNRSSNSSKYTVYSLNTGSNNPAWHSIASSVKELYFSSNFANYKPTTCYGWARDMTNLTKVTGFYNLDTSNVTTMAYMFKDCSSLKTLALNWGSIVTTKVTNMGYMFYGCSSLTTLTMASNFNTSNVTDFGFMFYGCSSLSTISANYFNTAKATYMVSMFNGCSSLTSLDVSKFNTENAKIWLNEIFNGCSKLTSLDLSSFTIGTANAMLKGCSSLAYLKVPSSANNLASNACTGVGTASKPCVLEFPDGFTPNGIEQGNGYITWKSGYFNIAEPKPYAVFENSTLTFYYDARMPFRTTGTKYNLNTGSNVPGWQSISTEVTRVVFDSSFAEARPTSCFKWFANMSNLSTITRISYLNTSNVTTMAYMFKGCSSLKTLALNWSSIVTTKVTDMSFMFNGCFSLTTLTMASNFNTSNVTDFGNMFDGCFSLSTISANYFNTAKATNMERMFGSCRSIESLNVSNFNTANVTNMSGMFAGCIRLDSLNVSNFNTANVTDMSIMFASCGVENLDLSSFNTANVTDMKGMFSNCSLESLNVSNFNTAKVTDMSGMFSGCIILPSLNLSSFNTANVTDMRSMFDECEFLQSLDVSHFNTAKVTNMARMFAGCSGLKSLNLSSFNTAKVTDMSEMFVDCYTLDSLNVSNFIIPENTQLMFDNCYNLKWLSIPSTASRLIDACQGVGTQDAPCTLVYPAGFTPEKTSSGDGWYEWKSGYFKDAINEAYALLSTDEKTLTFYYDKYKFSRPGNSYELNIQNTPPAWYSSVSSVTSVVFDASFADARPTSCCQWFAGMDNLTTIRDIDNLRTDEVTSMRSMFQGCSNLAILDVSGFSTSNVEIMTSMFSGCSSLESLDVSGFDTRKVTNMSYMFTDCSSLTSLDVRGFDTKKVTNMSSMFTDCSSLTSLDLSKFTFKDNIRTNYFLYFCSGLQTLIIPASAGNLNGNACSNVGSRYAPCTLVYPSDFTPEKTSTGDGWYEWKSGYFKDAFKKGDANGDGSVSVSDVMMTVNSVLGSTPPDGFHFDNANVNGDKVITVADVMAIVEIVLSNTSNNAPAHSRYSGADGMGLSANDGHCTVVLDNSEPFTALQFTIVMPEGAELGNVAMMQARSDGHLVKMQAVAPGRYNMMVFAPSGAPLRDGTTALLHFDFSGCQPGDIAIEGTQLVNSQYETVLPTGVVTAITGIEADGATDAQPYYNTVGVKVKTPSRGVYIKNGKKVVVK